MSEAIVEQKTGKIEFLDDLLILNKKFFFEIELSPDKMRLTKSMLRDSDSIKLWSQSKHCSLILGCPGV